MLDRSLQECFTLGDSGEAGADITVRFIWSDITPRSARWEQAFSPDDGNTWETNWIMEFTRRESVV